MRLRHLSMLGWNNRVAAVVIAVIAPAVLGTASPALAVSIMESRVEADSSGPVYWTSPDQVLFPAFTDEHVVREDGFRERVRRVTTWNVKTKEVVRLGRISGGLCYDRGRISYIEHNLATKQYWSSYGRLDGVVEREERHIRFDQVTCLPEGGLPTLPEWTKDRWVHRLRPEHGFLDLGPRREMKNTAIRLSHFGSDSAVELPIKRREFLLAKTRFYPFKDAYFLESIYFAHSAKHPDGGINQGPWPRDLPRPIWWLFPDGKVEKILIPPAIWMRDEIVPTKVALVAYSNVFFTVTGEDPYDGVYVLDGKGGAERVLRGVTGATATSEDGCKLAVRRQPEPGVKRSAYWTISVLDLCKGK